MSGVNKVILLGNVGNDPQTFTDKNGNLISAKLSLATSQKWKDKNSGENVEHTEWHKVTFFKKLADIVDKYIKKGSKIYVEGMLRTNKWTDKNGQDRYTTEIIASNMQMFNSADTNKKDHSKETSQESYENLELNDDIPF